MSGSSSPETPDETIPQDPGIPGWDVVSDATDAPLPEDKDAAAEKRERPDDADREGQMTTDA